MESPEGHVMPVGHVMPEGHVMPVGLLSEECRGLCCQVMTLSREQDVSFLQVVLMFVSVSGFLSML